MCIVEYVLYKTTVSLIFYLNIFIYILCYIIKRFIGTFLFCFFLLISLAFDVSFARLQSCCFLPVSTSQVFSLPQAIIFDLEDTSHTERKRLFEQGLDAYSEKDYERAYAFFLASERDKDGLSEYFLGLMYFRGEKVTRNPYKAAHYFMKSGKKGVAVALHDLALLYKRGEGVKRNFKKAFFYMKQAAELGDLPSQFNLGQYYRKGFGIKPSSEKAFYWYHKSAQAGFLSSMYETGLCYAIGEGVAQNRKEAYAWISLADTLGLSIDTFFLSLLKKDLKQLDLFVQAEKLKEEKIEYFKNFLFHADIADVHLYRIRQ